MTRPCLTEDDLAADTLPDHQRSSRRADRWLRLAWLGLILAGAQPATLLIAAAPSSAGVSISPREIQWSELSRPSAQAGATLFSLLPPEHTGINLTYGFPANAPMELLQDQGGGIGLCAGDFDSDGLPDLFVTNYDRGCHLYRNAGGWQFQDVTARAGVGALGRWCAGATFVDLDNDGDLDLAVCAFNAPNLAFLNQGDGTFREQTQALGLGFVGASVMQAFADYDLDGDLDAYLVTHRLSIGSDARLPRSGPDSLARGVLQLGPDRQPVVNPRFTELFELIGKGGGRMELYIAGQRDILFRNLGGGRFTNFTAAAGLSGNEIGLAATWWDYDQDGWPDLYVSNDYKGPDRLWRNRGDGTFTDVARTVLPHVPWSSMGADSADLNNDGRFDFIAMDMAGSHQRRRLLTVDDLSERWFLTSADPRQYSRNALYLATGGQRCFEAAYLVGLATTDWTWAPKFADFDNDGWIDLFVANGMARDFLNTDLLEQMRDRAHRGWRTLPVLRERNLAFRNRGDLRFEQAGQAWGLDRLSASYSAVSADFDRDGDLDLVVSNFDEPLSIYRNDSQAGHRILIRLQGTHGNSWGIGATVRIETSLGAQIRSLNLTSGFMSANEPLVHFGLGDVSTIQRLTVKWSSGVEQPFTNLLADRFYTIVEPSVAFTPRQPPPAAASLFRPAPTLAFLRHQETQFDDFQREPLLPWKLSQLGPGLALADVNGDGREDVYLGGAAGHAGVLALREANGRFQIAPQACFAADRASEDMGALFFDADGDGDMDLYVASGGVECEPGDPRLRDRLYLNDGHGRFEPAPPGALPDVRDAGSIVAAADFDRDGDLDLFVGGRLIPGHYPLPADSRLLRNDRGQFSDATASLAPGLLQTGLVTSALWSDANNDGWPDLLVTHEWGPVKLFLNEHGRMRQQPAGLPDFSGWWNGIAAGDIDDDGDIDFAVSNCGLNTRYRASATEPALLLLGDFDGSGRAQLIEGTYDDGTLLPLRSRNALAAAIPSLTGRFPSAKDFALASLTEILTPARVGAAKRFTATTLESGILLNDGKGEFKFHALPRLAQIAPAFGVALLDVNADGHLDLLLAHNFFSPQPETGRMDGGMSLLLQGDGRGGFTPIWPSESGVMVPGDAKSAVFTDLNDDGWPDLIIGVNDAEPRTFLAQPRPGKRYLQVRLRGRPGNPTGIGARVELILTEGLRVAEVYAGGGYLSQSTPVLSFGLGASEEPRTLQVRWPSGQVSSISLTPGQSSVQADE